jgi:uracil-DNA glycosylase family 4
MPCPCNIRYTFVPPRGPKDARIYIVGMNPEQAEVAAGEPFIGKAGQVLRSALVEAKIDLDKEVRLFNVVNCRTIEETGEMRSPTREEIDNCKPLVFADIKKTKPESIICTGELAASAFINTKEYSSVTEMTKVTSLSWEGIPLRVAFHPSYIARNGGVGTPLYNEYVRFLNQFSLKKKVHYELKTLTTLSPQEFTVWDPPYELGFDIEATTLETLWSDLFVCGLGFADKEGNGYYVPLRTRKDLALVATKLKEIILTRCLYVFNFSYEGTVMATQLQIHPYEWHKMIDTRQVAMMLGMKSSLKDIALKLGFPNWEDQMFTVVEYLGDIYKLICKGKKDNIELKSLRESWESFIDAIKQKPKLTPILDKLDYLKSLYPEDNLDKGITFEDVRLTLCDQATKRIKRKFYELAPLHIISEYCAFDSYAALKIYELLTIDMNEEEIKGIPYFMEHAELGAALECAGVGWNLEEAKRLDIYYSKELLKTLRSFLSNESVRKILEISTHDLVKINSDSDLSELKKHFNPNSNHVNTRAQFNKILESPFTRKVYVLWQLHEFVNQSPEGSNTELKNMFVYLTREAERDETIKDEGLREEKFRSDMKPINAEKRLWIETADEEIIEMIEAFETPKRRNNRWKDEPEQEVDQVEVLKDSLNKFELEKMDEATVVPLYHAFSKIGGTDIDDTTTWTTQFEALYLFRVYKKIGKAFSTYLWGTVGMEKSARLIKTSHRELVSPPRFEPNWSDIFQYSNDKFLPLVSWEFNVNGADTNRWKSAYHVWPWQCELQDLRISRYPNGLLAHCDYSQQEVRVIAFLAGENMLLQAYKENRDIHRFMASRIFSREEKEVSDAERRYSKMLTFSLLYGKGEEAIALDFLGGDVGKAKKLFKDFFTAFPKIASYVKDQHKKVSNGDRFVRSVLGERIYLRGDSSTKSGLNQLKRFSVNYPVQSSASHLAAVGINRLNRAAFNKKMRVRAYGFTHDAMDVDLDALYLFEFFALLQEHMQDGLVNEFGIPVKIEAEIGVTGNHMIEFEVEDRNEAFIEAKIKGTKDSLEQLENRLTSAGLSVNIETTGSTIEFVSRENLFMEKRAFSENMGQSHEKIKGKIKILKEVSTRDA